MEKAIGSHLLNKELMKIVLIIVVMLLGYQTKAQGTNICSTRFVPHQVTYNGSLNLNECWESVANGILIETKEVKGFFSLPNKVVDELERKIGDAKVFVEVLYYDEPEEGSGLTGQVKKITLKGEVLFDAAKL